MITRLSTPGQHSAAIAQILKQQVALSKTQVQVASGQRFQSPAEDPIAATRVLGLERTQAQLDQYGRNADSATQRLVFAEQALNDLGLVLERAHVLALQANNATVDDASLKLIASELRGRAEELLQIANRQDANGEYLFAGYATGTRPFSPAGGNVSYAGDQGVRQLALSATQKIADGFNGEQVFMNIPQGNGAFTVTAGTHAGSGLVGVNEVVDRAAWAAASAAAAAVPQPHAYTIRFTDPDADGTADTWEAVDAGGNPVATGSYASGGVISFNGLQVSISGAPAEGDTYEIAPAGTQSMFSTLDQLIGALMRGGETPEARAQLGSDLNAVITQLKGSMDHVLNLRAETGARLATLDSVAVQRDDLGYELTDSIGKLRDLDYAEALSRLNQQMAGLQAAQSAYTRIGQMSLFDFL